MTFDIFITIFEVLQRTAFGPLLFVIYKNGLLNLDINGKIVCFEDDTLLLVNGDNINDVYYRIMLHGKILNFNWIILV